MNYIKKISIALLLAIFSFSIWSCESYVDGNNISPNSPTDADVKFMVVGTQLSLNVAIQGEASRVAGIWSGYFTGADRQYIAYEDYAMTAGDFNGFWGQIYAGTVINSRIMQDKYGAVNNKAGIGMAQIMEAMAIGTVSNLYGDVPFSEATNEAFPNPSFDGQASVYAGVQNLLDEGIANLASGNGAIANDLYYSGDAGQWIKLANTLKAKFYLHTGDYASAKAAAANGIMATADNMNGNVFPVLSAAAKTGWNLTLQFTWWDREGYMTAEKAYLPTLLDASSPNYRGNAKTDEAARYGDYYLAPGDYSALDPNFYGFFWYDRASPMVSAVENHLILAECESRGGNDTAALAHLNAARSENNAFYGGYSDYVMGDFGPSAMVQGSSASDALFMEIMEEKYVSLYSSLETFADIRRTDNVLNIPSRSSANPIPERFLYPQTEADANTSFPGVIDLFTPTPLNQ